MKKGIKKALIAVIMFTAVLTYAAGGFSSTATMNDAEITHVAFGKISKGSKVLIKDRHGLILYKESIRNSGLYSKDFDLTALPDGDYYFELDTAFEIKIIPFKVMLNSVTFDKEGETIISKPRVAVKGNYVYVYNISLEKKPLEIAIYYNNDEFMYSELIENKQRIQRIYDFSVARSGNYEIVLKTDGRKFRENVKI